MSVTDIWKVHSIEIVPYGGANRTPANVTFADMSNVTLRPQANVVKEVPAGSILARHGRLELTSYDLEFTTTQVRDALSQFGTTANCFDSQDNPTGYWINIYVAKFGCAGPESGAVHRMYTLHQGIASPRSLSCTHKGDATATVLIRALNQAGSNDVLVLTEDVELPSAAQIADAGDRWTMMGELGTDVNNIAIEGKTNIDIDFGNTVTTIGADSELIDSFATVDSVLPVTTITGVNQAWVNGVGLAAGGVLSQNGHEIAHNETNIWLRKRSSSGGFEAANGIRLTLAGLAYYSTIVSSSGTEPGTVELRIEGTDDGTGAAPITLVTTSGAVPTS